MKVLGKGLCNEKFNLIGEVLIIKDDEEIKDNSYYNKIIFMHVPAPDIVIYMNKALAIVTETGGVLCHAAVLAMELGVPFIVGAENIIKNIKNGDIVRIEGLDGIGYIYEENV